MTRSLLPTVSTEQLASVSGGKACSFSNYGAAATITPEGGAPIEVPEGSARSPSVVSVPQGMFGLRVGDRTFRSTSGSPASFACVGQAITVLPHPDGPRLLGAR